MFLIPDNSGQTINITRGDACVIEVSAKKASTGEAYTFKSGDTVRLKVFAKKQCDAVVIKKDVTVGIDCTSVSIFLEKEDTKIGEIINKPKDYWYEIELNPDTAPRTIVGYDLNGPKIFRLFPEGGDMNEQ